MSAARPGIRAAPQCRRCQIQAIKPAAVEARGPRDVGERRRPCGNARGRQRPGKTGLKKPLTSFTQTATAWVAHGFLMTIISSAASETGVLRVGGLSPVSHPAKMGTRTHLAS